MEKKELEIKPIQKKKIPEIIIQELKSLIDMGKISTGDKLPTERELSSMLNVSRPPLREALKTLSLLGILENKPGKGTFLRSSPAQWPIEPFIIISLESGNVLHIYEARQALEVIVAGLASERRERKHLSVMKKALEKMRCTLDNPKKYIENELQFHKAVTEASKNPVMIDIMEKLYQQLENARKAAYKIYSKKKSKADSDGFTESDETEWCPSNPSFLEQDLKNHELIFQLY